MTTTSTEDYSNFYDTMMQGISGDVDWNAVSEELSKYGITLGNDFWKGRPGTEAPQTAADAAKYLNLDGPDAGIDRDDSNRRDGSNLHT
jgi:hypothetical protein